MPGSVGRFGVGKVPICSGLSEIEGFGECESSSVKTRIVLANRAMRVALDRASELGKGPLSPTSKSYLFIQSFSVLSSPRTFIIIIIILHVCECFAYMCVCIMCMPGALELWLQPGCRELNPGSLE